MVDPGTIVLSLKFNLDRRLCLKMSMPFFLLEIYSKYSFNIKLMIVSLQLSGILRLSYSSSDDHFVIIIIIKICPSE